MQSLYEQVNMVSPFSGWCKIDFAHRHQLMVGPHYAFHAPLVPETTIGPFDVELKLVREKKKTGIGQNTACIVVRLERAIDFSHLWEHLTAQCLFLEDICPEHVRLERVDATSIAVIRYQPSERCRLYVKRPLLVLSCFE